MGSYELIFFFSFIIYIWKGITILILYISVGVGVPYSRIYLVRQSDRLVSHSIPSVPLSYGYVARCSGFELHALAPCMQLGFIYLSVSRRPLHTHTHMVSPRRVCARYLEGYIPPYMAVSPYSIYISVFHFVYIYGRLLPSYICGGCGISSFLYMEGYTHP